VVEVAVVPLVVDETEEVEVVPDVDSDGVLCVVELVTDGVVLEVGVLTVPVLVVTLTVLDTDGEDAVDTRLV
jgi:hypothetical protein